MQTEIVTPEKRIYSRTEIVVENLPLAAEGYVYWERRGDLDLFKLRLQMLPLHYGAASFGAVAQHREPAGSETNLGAIARVSTSWAHWRGRLDVRCFPGSDLADGYGIVSIAAFSVDNLMVYSGRTETLTLRPGIDYRLGGPWSFGVEACFSDHAHGVHSDYTGLRARATF